MKTAKDIFLSWDKINPFMKDKLELWDELDWTLLKKNKRVYVENIINLIEEAQIDAIQHTVKVCADKIKENYNHISNPLFDEAEVFILNEFILSVADKLIKKIK